MIAQFDRYERTRRVRFGREAVLPFAVGLVLVIAGAVTVAAAMTGTFGTRQAPAAPTAPTDSIDPTATTMRACRAPEAVADSLPDDSNQKPAFGFVVFDWDTTQGSSMPGFGPATACRLPHTALDG